jgi:Na+-driven multidrug efflux pump
MGLVLGIFLIICSKGLIALFGFTPEGERDAFLILLVYGSTMAIDSATGTLVTGILRSGGDTRFAMLADTGTIWLIGVPLAWFAASLMHWPIYIAVLLARQEEVVKLIVLMKRFLSKKWVRNVIGGL